MFVLVCFGSTSGSFVLSITFFGPEWKYLFLDRQDKVSQEERKAQNRERIDSHLR